MNIGERVKFIRTDETHMRKALTLDQFGERIGLKKSALSLLENGKSNITDQTVKSICREFNVSEEWLRYGRGDPYVSLTREEELANLIADAQKDPPDSIRNRLLSIMANLDEEDWQALARIAEKIANE